MQVSTPTTGDYADSCASAVDTDLGWALGMVFRAYVKAANHAVADLPGGPRGYQLLTIAARALPATQLAIAQQLGVDRTVMTYLLDDLESAGLVERQPDPADRRARRIIATDKGHARLAELQQRLRLAEDHVLAALDEPKRDTFRDLVRSLATHANTLDPEANPCQVVDDIEVAETTAASPRLRRGRRSTARR
ncbi:MarR family transcriptional regulator [Actinomadura sp. HBU206391]|nr:MarR family transcriptional regulator [Actinomadura sp. HBU206391]